MGALPRALCSVCGREVAVRRNLTAREHVTPFDKAAFGKKATKPCIGSGKPAMPIKRSWSSPSTPPPPMKVDAEPLNFFSCRITTDMTVSICTIRHRDLNKALAHGRKIKRGLGGRALMVEIVSRTLMVTP